jgi:TolA-binding protein
MRFRLLGLILLVSTAAPAMAQPRSESVERRLDRVEQQLRAVQRRVFPGGSAQFVEPEIGADVATRPDDAPSDDAVASLSARLDSIEAQMRTLTGQVEQQGYRIGQIEEQIGRLRTDLAARLDRLEQGPRPSPSPAAATRPAPEPAAEPPSRPARTEAAPAATDDAEDAYNVGYRLWDQGRFAEAQTALEAAAVRYPNSRWTSWMRNMQGRAYLDDNKPATAARILLANYQENPRGERAADSLYYLGVALTRLNRRPEACRVFDELAQVYPNMRDFLRQRLPQARAAARCGTTGN